MKIKDWLPLRLGQDILTGKYLQPGETLDAFFDRVAGGNARFRQLLVEQKVMPAGRILSNRGVSRKGSISNCYVLVPPEDNIESIWECAMRAARTYSYGGGCGIDLGKLAPRGAGVNNEAKTSSGAVSFMELFATTTSIIGQNGRRGALMLSLPVEHPDIQEFIHAKEQDGVIKTANISVRVSDAFMEAVENGDDWVMGFRRETGEAIRKCLPARQLFREIAESAWDNAEPGVLFWDTVCCHSYLSEDPEFQFAGTNPCLTGDTLIQTADGEIPIRDLVGQTPYVYSMDADGKLTMARASKVWLTRKNAQLVEVTTSRGSLKCTPDHLIHTRNRGWVKAEELKKGDKVTGLNRSMKDEIHVAVALSGSKKYVPEHRFIMAAFQDITGKDVHHIDNDTLHNVRSNLEVLDHSDHSRISNTGRKIESIRNEKGQYVKKSQKAPVRSINQGERSGTNWFVQSVNWLEEKEDVYDMTVPETHCFVANRMVVHNCGEEPLPAGGSCLLTAMNLAAYVQHPFSDEAVFDIKAFCADAEVVVGWLNDLLDEGLEKHPLQEQKDSVAKWRQIGLGIMGLGDALAMLKLRYGSREAVSACRTWASALHAHAFEESVRLGEVFGSYPGFHAEAVNRSEMLPLLVSEVDALRNSQILTCAPTGSISTMLGVSGGIEPIFSVKGYSRKTESLHGKDVVYADNSSYAVRLYHDMFPGQELPDYFVGAHDIPWRERLEMQAAWQKHIDAAISSTVNLPHDTTVEEVEQLYLEAWRLGLKGVTVYRDGCRRSGVLQEKGKEKAAEEAAPQVLRRGEVAPVPEGLLYRKHCLRTGCGKLYLFVGVDEQGHVHDVYTNTSGEGGCMVNTNAVSRGISIQLRAGVPIPEIAEQLERSGTCPSYQFARGARKELSRGKSCASSIARVLMEYQKAAEDEPAPERTNRSAAPAAVLPEPEAQVTGGRICPVCGQHMVEAGGCPTCRECGWSPCG